MLKLGESQSQRRTTNQTRQNKARTEVFDNNREISGFDFSSPSNERVSRPVSAPVSVASMPTTITTATSTLPTVTSILGSSTTVPVPAPAPVIDINRLYSNLQTMSATTPPTDVSNAIKDMHGMLVHLVKKSDESDHMKKDITCNSQRIDRLEAKVGKPDDLAIPLSLAIRNLPLPGHGADDYQIVRALFFEINAKEFNVDRDIINVIRQGATAENQGTVMVELRSDEARASIMKTKKVLEHHPNPELRRVIIKNMKSKAELKMDIALNQMLKKLPGGENFYIANNGHIREKTPQQKFYQNSLQTRIPPRPAAGFSMPQYSMPPPSYPAPPPVLARDYNPLPPPSVIYQGSYLPPTVAQQNFPFNPSGSGPHQEPVTRLPGPPGDLSRAGQFSTLSEPITAPLIQFSTPDTNALPIPGPQMNPTQNLAEKQGVTAMDGTNPPTPAQPPQQHPSGHGEQLQQPPVHHTQQDQPQPAQPNVQQVPVCDT